MKKLKLKVFLTIFIILTISAITFFGAYNVQKYMEKKRSVEDSLMFSMERVEKENIITFQPFNENVRVIDSIIYTVFLDQNDNIQTIVNHSNNNMSIDKIRVIASKILSNKYLKYRNINNLYLSNYSYFYLPGESLIIIDTSFIRSTLFITFISSIIVLLLVEIVIVIISKLISDWITKPAEDVYLKQKQFVADVSHELKTPLSVIMASSEALEENPKEKKWLNNINNETSRMNLLITDLLELAASENQDSIEYKVGNLSKAVELSVLTFEGKAYEKGIKLKYDIEDNIKFKMNENSIKQVVEILLDNAIKHSKENSIVNIDLKTEGNSIKLTVKNAGEAIPKGEEEKIFERFYRVDKSRNRKENRYGLGLAIAKNIVESHNGIIKAFSKSGKTIFQVSFKK